MASQRTRVLINLGLLALVTVLAALALRPGSETPEDRLTDIEPAAIERIRVETGEQPPVVLERRGDEWWLTEPWEISASERRIEDLRDFATTRSFARYAAADLELDRYDLDPPRIRLWLNDTLIELGKTNPVNRQRYARVGDTVHLIDDTRTYLLSSTVASYLGPRLLPRDAAIERIELPNLVVSRDPAGGWRSDAQVSSDQLQALIDAWSEAQALWARELDAPADPAWPRVTITLADGRRLDFAVAGTDPDLVLARPDLGIAYTLPGDTAARLLEARPAVESVD